MAPAILRARARRASALAVVALVAGSARAAQNGLEPRPFSIPNARQTAAVAREAQEFLDAGRWSEALVLLQELVGEHGGKLLEGRTTDEAGRVSQEIFYRGAADWARQRLLEHVAELGPAYRERFGPQARAALEACAGTGDPAALVDVARRWPLAEAAAQAWWMLGDLELERGQPADAASAWKRARELSEALGIELGAGAERRLQAAVELGDSDKRPPARFLTLPGPGQGARDVPRYDAHSWTLSLGRSLDRDYLPRTDGASLIFPILWGDTLFVSTGLRLYAIDAYAGELRWVSDEPRGWNDVPVRRTSSRDQVIRSEFFEAVDRENLMLAPAASEGVVVCALQVPVTQSRKQVFQGQFEITKVNPDRRLYAFDAQTGRELWNHYPPPGWDGESGSFTDRMSVAGPPVIAGSRVLVPMYRLRGRVEYHVACFELSTGALLWSANLISGQRELNMFGRHVQEFSAPPLAVDGGRVVALTQLGAIAALDLYTGELLWETLYNQLSLPGTVQWHLKRRDLVWANAPPVIVGGVVLATPLDSRDLVAVDAASGRMLWARSRERIEGSSGDRQPRALLGADEDSVWIGGHPILAGHASAGLAAGSAPRTPFEESRPFLDTGRMLAARPAMGARFIVVPTSEHRAVLDRYQLGRGRDDLHSAPWRGSEGPGNLLLAEGALFVCTGQEVHGFFEWGALESRLRARLEADPTDPDLVARYASLYYHHARDQWEAGRLRDAWSDILRAREVLEPALAELGPAQRRARADLSQRLFDTLRAEALVLQELADPAAALERLRRARALAPNPGGLCEVWLQEIDVRDSHRDADWLAALESLDEECGHLWMPETYLPFQDEERAEPGGRRASAPLPVGLWTLERRAQHFAEQGDAAREFALLHEALERYGDVGWPAPGEAAEGTVSGRILALLAAGHRAEYAPFEARAQELLAEALAAGDEEALQRVVERFPGSQAGRRAGQALLDQAAARGDVERIVAVVGRLLPHDFKPSSATPEEVRILLRLAAGLNAINPECARGMLRSLARHHADLVVDVEPWNGQRLGDLAPREKDRRATPETASFEGPLDPGPSVRGPYQILGHVRSSPSQGEDPGQELLVVRNLQRSLLQAWSADDLQKPRWEQSLFGALHTHYLDGRYAFASGNLLLAAQETLVAYDLGTGEVAWSWSAKDERRIERVEVDSGVAVLFLVKSFDESRLLVALETRRGLPLWSRAVPSDTPPRPLTGWGSCLVFPGPRGGKAQVLDLYTGVGIAEVDLGPAAPRGREAEAAWIENGQLVLPAFEDLQRQAQRRPWVSAFDLESGLATWQVDAQEGRELYSVVQSEGATYLVTLPTEAGRSGTLLDLDTRAGAQREVPDTRLRLEDLPIGVTRYGRTDIGPPLLFVQSSSPGGDFAVVRAIRLPYGELWSHTLHVSMEELWIDDWPLPAVSRDTIALAYSTTSKRSRSGQPRLLVLGRRTGQRIDEVLLSSDMGAAGRLELSPLGDALVIASDRDSMQFFRRSDRR